MPQAFAPVRPAAPIQSANDAATSPDLIQLHLAATNSLAAALHTLRTTDLSPADLARAIARARRGATHLRHMAELAGGAA